MYGNGKYYLLYVEIWMNLISKHLPDRLMKLFYGLEIPGDTI